MKKTVCIIFLLICLLIFSGFSGTNLFGSKVNRSSEALFPREKPLLEEAYVHIEKGYAYHTSRYCDTEKTLLGLDIAEYTKMTEYEAIYRGFFECPDCKRRHEIDSHEIEKIIENTVESSIIDTLVDLFGQ